LIILSAHAKVTVDIVCLESLSAMFFTRIGKVLAHLIFWFSALRVAMAFLVAFGTPDMESNRAAASRLLGAATSGEVIDKGMMYIFFALVLGVLCEISSKGTKPEEKA
jgi:hypothetical protein